MSRRSFIFLGYLIAPKKASYFLTIWHLNLILAATSLAQREPTYLFGNIPHAERIGKLKPYFTPPIGSSVAVDHRDLRDSYHKKSKINPLTLRGFIRVSPPKGFCFLVTRDLDEPDEKVCKQTNLSFTLSDLQKNGNLLWTIKTGPLDFGTLIFWTSPYRVASMVAASEKTDKVDHRIIFDCQAKKNTPLGHQIIVEFFGGEKWLIDFPEQEELLPQPPSIPNLYIAIANKKGIPKDKGTQSTVGTETSTGASQKTDAATPNDTDTKTSTNTSGNAKEGGTSTESTVSESTDPVVDQLDDREVWAIPARNGYKMEGYRFMPYGTTTKWFKGECRYIYSGPSEDPETGRMECHDVDGFKEVYLPLTCLKDFKKI